jgi:uncharacterized membrane protein YphA (DoxX/SURF4 family)
MIHRRSSKWLHTLHWLARTGIGLLFLYAGVVKMRDPVHFVENVKAFELTSPRWTEVLTFGVPALETVAGLILLLGIPSLWRGAAVVLAGLLAVFGVAIAAAWWRGLPVSCGCFGETSGVPTDPVWWLIRNAALAGILISLAASLGKNGRASLFPNSLWRS